ncbi:MAG: calcium/sodium antiporter [Candidatus Pacebacteria bacterium]|nr:calcium/sodium antiporter [Candidatus Paceibacterota bacterium]
MNILEHLTITSNMSTLVLLLIFVIALFILIKGGDYLLEGAERVGNYFKLPYFVIGALIVGIGTSLPELASSLFAVFNINSVTIVASNAIGSNIANILLVAGLSATVGGVIISTKELVRLEIPLLVLSTSLFIFVAYDGIINIMESFIIAIAFIIYLSYLLNHDKYEEKEMKVKQNILEDYNKEKKISKITTEPYYILGGGIGLAVGAYYLIGVVIALSEKFDIAPGIIGLSAVALGTSLPEIVVSVKAVLRGKMDLAFGNVFGSNVFNMLMIVGITGVVGPIFAGNELSLDGQTLKIALPFLALTTVIFYVSAMSKRIYIWEGLMYILFYILFSLKIFGLV